MERTTDSLSPGGLGFGIFFLWEFVKVGLVVFFLKSGKMCLTPVSAVKHRIFSFATPALSGSPITRFPSGMGWWWVQIPCLPALIFFCTHAELSLCTSF